MEAQRLELEREQIELQKRRLALLEKRAEQAERAQQVITASITPAEKERRLKQIFGIA